MPQNIINGLPKGTILHGQSYNYEIIKALGQGSFGITYLAIVKMQGNLGTIDSTVHVAIKEFFMHKINGREQSLVTCGSEHGLFDKYRKKFITEAQNLSKLKHAHIIKVIEIFEENNTYYYSMEFINGGSLDEYIVQKGHLPEGVALGYIAQIASALSFMHSQNMLHLDLKPSNVMMQDANHLTLIDFGLSKQFNEKGEPVSSIKIGGGTEGYAPIEQATYDGNAQKGLPVTMDIYALGGTLCKMLTGERPPEASYILNEGFPIYKLQEKNISEKTISLVAKAMAPLKKNRFQDISAFVSAIDHKKIEKAPVEETAHKEENTNGEGKIHYNNDSDITNIINQLIQNEQYKEAYNLCLDCIKRNENIAFANKKCEELIPLLKKKANKDSRKQTIIITIVTIAVTFLSILLGLFNN